MCPRVLLLGPCHARVEDRTGRLPDICRSFLARHSTQRRHHNAIIGPMARRGWGKAFNKNKTSQGPLFFSTYHRQAAMVRNLPDMSDTIPRSCTWICFTVCVGRGSLKPVLSQAHRERIISVSSITAPAKIYSIWNGWYFFPRMGFQNRNWPSPCSDT